MTRTNGASACRAPALRWDEAFYLRRLRKLLALEALGPWTDERECLIRRATFGAYRQLVALGRGQEAEELLGAAERRRLREAAR